MLEQIIENKRQELAMLESFDLLEEKIDDLMRQDALPTTRDFLTTIREHEGPGIIAELQKASPGKGLLRQDFDVLELARTYQNSGACCFSVWTDSKFFQGSYENLILVSSEYELPCLCKEFIIDSRQIAQARLSGADAILLIASVLSDRQLEEFGSIAAEFDMDVLLEVNSEEEMHRALNLDFEFIAINNRNLKDFSVSLDTSSKLISKFKYDLPGRTLVAGSGINQRQDVLILYNMGVKAFLVGEDLLTQDNPGQALQQLLT